MARRVVRPLCVFDAQPMPYPNKVTGHCWLTVHVQDGLDVEYQMLRGIFMPRDRGPDFYVAMSKVRELPEWKEFMEKARSIKPPERRRVQELGREEQRTTT